MEAKAFLFFVGLLVFCLIGIVLSSRGRTQRQATRVRKLPVHDYSKAIEQKKLEMGDAYLCANPVNELTWAMRDKK